MKKCLVCATFLIFLIAFHVHTVHADDWEAKGYTYTEVFGASLGVNLLEARLFTGSYSWGRVGLGASLFAYNSKTDDTFALRSWLPIRLYLIPYVNLEGGKLNSLVYLYGGGSWWAEMASDANGEQHAEEEERRAQYWDVGVGWRPPYELISSIRLGFLNAHIEGRSGLPEENHSTIYLVLDLALGAETDAGKTSIKKDVGWRAKGIRRTAPSLLAFLEFNDASKDGILDAGEEAKVIVKITNKGNKSARKVSVQAKVMNEKLMKYLDMEGSLHLEELKPGKSETLVFTLKAKGNLPSGKLTLDVAGGDREGHPIERVSFTLQTRSYKDYLMAAVGEPELPPYPKASLKIQPVSATVQAESQLRLTLRVENTGKGPLYQLLGKIECENPFLSGKEFPLGLIKPGEEREYTLTLAVPPRERNQDITFDIVFSEYNDYVPDPIRALISIEELPRPRLTYSYQIIDDNTGNSVGNGDGRFQKGEAVDLLLTVKNIGSGEARDVQARIDAPSMEGLVLNIPSQEMGRLNPGEFKSTRLTVTAKKTLASDKIPLFLSIKDRFWDIEVKHEIDISLGESTRTQIIELRRVVLVKEKELEIYGGAGERTPVIAKIEEGGEILVTGQLGDWYRVDLPEDLKGWVPCSGVSLERDKLTEKQADKLVERTKPIVIRIFEQTPPSIAIFEPGRKVLEIATGSIEVAGLVIDDKGIEKLVIKVNGKIVRARSMVVVRKEKVTKMKFEETIPLSEGENLIDILAYDTDNLLSRETITVVRTKKIPSIWAVVIGISDYRDMEDAKYADKDARAFYDYLVDHLGVPRHQIKLLVNNEATTVAIKEVLGIFLKEKPAKDDQVIIYFAGHGGVEDDPSSPDGDGLSKYLLAHDTEKGNLYPTAIPMDEIQRIFVRISSERIIFIGDTCFSGAAGGRSPLERRATLSEKFLERLASGKGRIILAACGANEVSIADDILGHGVFTYYLLEALKGKADYDNDGFITVDEAYGYLTKEVPKATRQKQHPVKKGEVMGSFVIGRK